MLVDTGAANTAIDARFLSALGYAMDGDARIVYTANGPLRASTATLRHLRFGTYGRSDLSVSAVRMPEGIGGLLGADFLKDFILVVNYPKSYFELKTD